MRMTYLGIFQKVFDWVWDKILGPLIGWLTDILSSVLSWVFKEVLVPVLKIVFDAVLPEILDMLKTIFASIFYYIFAYLCKLIDYVSIAFDIFIGTRDVTYTNGAKVTEGPLLNVFFSMPVVNKAFWVIMVTGMGIALVLCIYAVIKSTIDMDFENKRPVGAVMRSMFKCFVNFLIIQLTVLIILNIAGGVMNTIILATQEKEGERPATMGCILFGVASLDASKHDSDNISYTGAGADPTQNFLLAGNRGAFYTGEIDYMNTDKVNALFYYEKFDYVVGFIVAIFLLTIMVICCITFVKRLFEILILYLVSPFFISTMPIDDGEKFKKWKEMFIAKVFSGYGSLLAMKLYLLLCPIIVDNSISWGGDETSVASSYIIKLLFLVGGAYSMTKVGPMITTMLNYQAGQSEEATSSYIGGKAFGMVASGTGAVMSGAAKITGKAIGAPYRVFKNMGGNSNGKEADKEDPKSLTDKGGLDGSGKAAGGSGKGGGFGKGSGSHGGSSSGGMKPGGLNSSKAKSNSDDKKDIGKRDSALKDLGNKNKSEKDAQNKLEMSKRENKKEIDDENFRKTFGISKSEWKQVESDKQFKNTFGVSQSDWLKQKERDEQYLKTFGISKSDWDKEKESKKSDNSSNNNGNQTGKTMSYGNKTGLSMPNTGFQSNGSQNFSSGVNKNNPTEMNKASGSGGSLKYAEIPGLSIGGPLQVNSKSLELKKGNLGNGNLNLKK